MHGVDVAHCHRRHRDFSKAADQGNRCHQNPAADRDVRRLLGHDVGADPKNRLGGLRGSGPAARRLERLGPPQQIVDQNPGLPIEFGQAGIDVAALEMCPERRGGDMNRRTDGGDLELDGDLAKLLDAADARCAAPTHEGRRLSVPLRVDPVERVLEYGRGTVIIFGRRRRSRQTPR
jgi:hypothetical protein